MTDPGPPTPPGPPPASNEPVSRLRGAGVNADARRVGHVVVGLCLVTLAVLVIVFTIVGFNNNSQINRLHNDGVPVNVTITACAGLLGGSGSNVTGYACKAAYTVHGHHYTESLPGTAFHRPGAVVRAVVVPSDPALVSPVSVESTQHASASRFILPAVLLVVLLLLVGLVLFLQRRRGATSTAAS